jgi:hypothetical protein
MFGNAFGVRGFHANGVTERSPGSPVFRRTLGSDHVNAMGTPKGLPKMRSTE